MFHEINLSRRHFLGTAPVMIAAVQLATVASAETWLTGGRRLASLALATTWLNAQPLTAVALRGRVVLIEFWTYSCINWRRQLPYVKAWAEKYKDQGLVVIGVHTPEFAFEKEKANVEKAVRDLGVTYPVAMDNNYAIWNTFGNEYWPAHYFFDATGA